MHILFLVFLSLNTFAETYETVVSDFVFNSSSRLVLTEEMIRNSNSPNIPSLLKQLAGISITSNPFQPTSISMSGGDSGHVLILVDGIPFYDPSTIQRTGNLSALNIKSVKRIEIIKGSQSVLYGGQALGGMIKIETWSEKDFASRNIELGTQSYGSAGAEYSNENILARGQMKGERRGSPKKGSSSTYPADQLNGDIAYRWRNSADGIIKLSLLKDHSFSPSSDANYNIVDVKNFELLSQQALVSGSFKLNEVAWNPRITFGLQTGNRSYDFPLSNKNSNAIDEKYNSRFNFFRIEVKPFESKLLRAEIGFQYSYEDFIFKNNQIKEADNLLEQRGLFTKFTSLLGNETELSYGARLENWTGKKNPVSVYQIGLRHKKTRAEISTGFKAPSLYQLHSRYGNPDLQEERGTQYSLSQEFSLSENHQFSVTLFWARFNNLVSTTGTYPQIRYVNINKSETRGAELRYSQQLNSYQSINFNLSYQEPKNLRTHSWLLRRPLNTLNLNYSRRDGKIATLMEILNVGTRHDSGPNGNFRLAGYTTANLSFNYNAKPGHRVFLRIDNLTGNRYEETYGYFAQSTTAMLGFTQEF
jgi:outer membrane cobalamin receptor